MTPEEIIEKMQDLELQAFSSDSKSESIKLQEEFLEYRDLLSKLLYDKLKDCKASITCDISRNDIDMQDLISAYLKGKTLEDSFKEAAYLSLRNLYWSEVTNWESKAKINIPEYFNITFKNE